MGEVNWAAKAGLNRACAMNELLESDQRQFLGQNWRKIVAAVDNLPPMPVVASRAIKMLDDPNSTANEVADLLNSDAGLASQILKIANSTLFARQREITMMSQAVSSVGYKAIKGVILASVMRRLRKNFGEKDRLIWENSVATGTAAQLICRRLRKGYCDEISLEGLLHNLGQLVFLSTDQTSRDYDRVFEVIHRRQVEYIIAENEVLGCPYTRVGALLANKWNFPPEICQIILHHKDPFPTIENTYEEKNVMIHLADWLAHAAEIGHPEGYPVDRKLMRDLAVQLGFDKTSVDNDLDEILDELRQQFQEERLSTT